MSKAKPFQQATIDHVVRHLGARGGSGRFLVADEVGLGKTLVAQGVIHRLLQQEGRLVVFYVCSSQAIARQNAERLLEFLPESEREEAQLSVNRLTLLPRASAGPRKRGLTLLTLTPGTMPIQSQGGTAHERAVIAELLRQLLGLRTNARIIKLLRHSVRTDEAWARVLSEVKGFPAGALGGYFRRHAARLLGLPEACWYSTLQRAIETGLEDETTKAETIRTLRAALALAGLDGMAPDLVILDEFQRFFDFLVPSSEGNDDETARELKDHLLGGHGDHKVLLLSATPYRLYDRWDGQGGRQHWKELVRLLEFLLGRKRRAEKERIERLFDEYGQALLGDRPGSGRVLALRNELQAALLEVMVRTERPLLAAEQLKRCTEPIEADDVRLFRHLRDSADPRHRAMVEGFWSSIPLPMQAMDDAYVLRSASTPQELRGVARKAVLDRDAVRAYRPAPSPHPRLRALREEVPPELLALPWMPPTLPWWKLGGPFARYDRREKQPSKVLVFSRYRAIPRIASALLSYEAERLTLGRKYDYFAHAGAEAAQPLAGRKALPRPVFRFKGGGNRSEADFSLIPLFFPFPTLAKLGDPLAPRLGKGGLERMVRSLAAALRERLGEGRRGRESRAVWRWALTLEHRSGTADVAAAGWRAWAATRAEGATELEEMPIARFAEEAPFPDGESPTRRELEQLARWALLAPGNVILRAAGRVFGGEVGAARIAAVSRASVEAFRGYVDTPDLHEVVGGRKGLLQLIWDGNLESCLDEYFAVQAGLQPAEVRKAERALEALAGALQVRTVSPDIRAVPPADTDSFRIRCHAALPLGLSKQEENAHQNLRVDSLRLAFNSPFRPFVLTTTSIGQEGLDFHTWCRHLVHWDLPSSPVDLEQREGRIRRYGSLAVRMGMLPKDREAPRGTGSPWLTLAGQQEEQRGGLEPWWGGAGEPIRRSVYAAHFSKAEDRLERLEQERLLYRLALGQVDQELFVERLRRRLADGDEAELKSWLELARLNLSPVAAQPSAGVTVVRNAAVSDARS